MVSHITTGRIGKFMAAMSEWSLVVRSLPGLMCSVPGTVRRPPHGRCRTPRGGGGGPARQGSRPALRAATTASPRVVAPSLRIAERR